MTSLNEIKAKIGQHNGFQHLTRYKVIFPSIHLGDDVVAMDAFCRSVTVPGKQLNSFVKRTNQKEIQVASGYSVLPINMRFSETNDNLIAKYIDFWQNSVVNPYDYLTEYRDYYTRNIFILKMNQQDEITYGVLLKKAWPKQKLEIDYSDFSSNTIAEQAVAFEYEDFEIVDHTLTGVVNNVIQRTRANILGFPLGRAIGIGKTIANRL